MKKYLVFILAFSLLALAVEQYGIYDTHGKLISTFESEQHELLEKAQQIKNDYINKKLYISSLKKGKNSKPVSRYQYKMEIGAYIEASRKEAFSVCLEKETQGTWISEYSVALDDNNCVSIQVPNFAGAFRILFLQNSGRTDTIQVFVDQSYIQMNDYSHKIWVTDLDYEKVTFMGDLVAGPWGSWEDIFSRHGRYESRSYSQPLIVDKTKFTMGDALYYDKAGNAIISHFTLEKKEYEGKKLEESNLPFMDSSPYEVWRFANERSKREGLDTAYIKIHSSNKDFSKFIILLGNPSHYSCKECFMFALDTSASGYRLPFEEEWFFLMHAGVSTRYYWGDNNDLPTLSRYEWVSPVGLKPVAQRFPNGFGLYDMMGIANENVHYFNKNGYWDFKMSCIDNLNPECTLANEIGSQEEYVEPARTTCELASDVTEWQSITGSGKCTTKEPEIKTQKVYYQSFRLLRKTPKLHKLEKF